MGRRERQREAERKRERFFKNNRRIKKIMLEGGTVPLDLYVIL